MIIVLIYVILSVVFVVLGIYIYIELKSKKKPPKITVIESKKQTIYVLGDKKDGK